MKLNRKFVLLFSLFWFFLVAYIVYQAPKDVSSVYSNMVALISPIEKINGNFLSEKKIVKSGAALIMLEFSSSRWSKAAEGSNSELMESLGAVRIKNDGKITYCRGREQYDIVPPGNYGYARYLISMSYPGTDCR
jgi:hypothetical protein